MSLPDLLRGTAETMEFGRRAGEWELDWATDAPVSELIATFLGAFEWATIRTFVAEYYDRTYTWEPDRPLQEWSKATADDAGGFHATLDLTLFWGEDDDVREVVVPDSGKLWFERDTDGFTLTIWPNLFTDRLPLYEREGTHSFRSHVVDWPLAAHRNRERLAASLRAWEAASGGELVAWSSELIDGVERYGFNPAATSLDAERR